MQLPLLLDRSRTAGLTTQIIEQLRRAIETGRIGLGVRLASTRRLSEQLGVSRNTVVRAYEILESEGYLVPKSASGIFVSFDWKHRNPSVETSIPNLDAEPSKRRVPRPATKNSTTDPGRRPTYDFFPGRASQSQFPIKAWRRVIKQCLSRDALRGLTSRPDVGGIFDLRSAIAQHLSATRGIDADPAQVIVVSGGQEALNIASSLILSPGQYVAMEDPCYGSANTVFEMHGAKVVRVPVDNEGLVVLSLPRIETALVYVTPDHQFPTGAIMPLDRRLQLANWTNNNGGYIFEDAYDSDIRYEGNPLPPIAAIAPELTFHVGTFSNTLGGGLRIGYMVVPSDLVEHVRSCKAVLSGGNSWLEQAALAEFIKSGSFGTHVMRLRTLFRENRDAAIYSLKRHFGDVVTSGEEAGLHFAWQLPQGVPDALTFEILARRVHVGISSMSSAGAYESNPSAMSRRSIFLGYSALSPKLIEDGVARLSQIVDDTLDARPAFFNELLLHEPVRLVPANIKPVPRIRQKAALYTAHSLTAQSSDNDALAGRNSMRVVKGIYRYPVKGLSGQSLPGISLEEGRPFPFDRIFALARPGVPIDEANPAWAKKGLFIMLMLEEGLARVRTWLDIQTLQLDIFKGPTRVLSANINSVEGRESIENFLHKLLPKLADKPKLVRSQEGHFMDKPDNVLSMINLATLHALEQRWGYKMDPLRFRANFYIDGIEPWEEFNWIGSDIKLGEALFRVDRRNGRCSATNVNPVNGERDLDIPGSLRAAFGHKDLGVYLATRKSGKVVVGDDVSVPHALENRSNAPNAGEPKHSSGRYMCRGCYYIYDEASGAPTNGVAAGTPFETIDEHTWRCPDCGTNKGMFRALALDDLYGRRD
jgi:GntR family transcriptional regulator/MocR family aminotransferase